MKDLTHYTPDSDGYIPEREYIGARLLHSGQYKTYMITGFAWLGASDQWGFVHHELRTDGLNGPAIIRPMEHLKGNRISTGKRRFEIHGVSK